MKKHIVLIMNIVLVVLIIGAIVFTLSKVLSDKAPSTDPVQPTLQTVPPTQAVTEPVERYKVGIVQHADKPSSKSCYEGFISQLKNRGLLDNIDVVYVVEEDDDKCKDEIQRLVDEGCDLLYTVGPFASKSAAAITEEIPIVFAAVSDPEDAGLVDSNESPGGNITGVSSYTPVFEQIDLIPVLLPKADSVASIYHSTDANAVRQAIIASFEAEEFEYKTDRYPVDDAEGIEKALDEIKQKGTDVIYLPIDKLMLENMDVITEFSKKNKVPIICGNRKMMAEGGLATCEINFTSIGRKSADLSYDILFGKKDPASLPVIYKYDCINLVNKQIVDELEIELTATAEANVTVIDFEAAQAEAAN